MRIINTNQIIKLWLIYQENGENVTGETDLSVDIVNNINNSVIASYQLTELGTTALYFYNWNSSDIDLETDIRVVYKKGTEILFSEEFYVDSLEDSDGIII